MVKARNSSTKRTICVIYRCVRLRCCGYISSKDETGIEQVIQYSTFDDVTYDVILPLGWAGSNFFSSEWVPYLPEHVGQTWLRSDGRVEKRGGDRQTDRQTDRQRFLQLYIVDGICM